MLLGEDNDENDMKKLTVKQFIENLKAATLTTESDLVETTLSQYEEAPDMKWGWIGNKIAGDGFTAFYQNIYEHPVGKPSEVTINSDVETLWQDDDFQFVVVDEQGEELDEHEVFELILNHTDIKDFDLDVLGDDEYQKIDITDEDDDMEKIIVKRDNDLDIEFIGESLGSATSSPNNARSDYSGNTGRWTELNLYQTRSGKYVCEQIGYTQWQGEHTRYSAAICDSTDGVIDFFGTGWLAKEIYEDAGIEATQKID